MGFLTMQLGQNSIERENLLRDKKTCRKFGPCGVGKKALYLNSFYIERQYYVPLDSVKRVFKRVAMSKGGFSGKGIFASIPYLVVIYDDGKEKQCNFKYEEQVDQMLAYIGTICPRMPLLSEEAEKKKRMKEAELAKRVLPKLGAEEEKEKQELDRAINYMERKPELFRELSAASRKKRTYDQSNPGYKWVALIIFLIGAATLAFGIYALINHQGFALYFMLFGLAAMFLFAGANVLPTSGNNKKAIEARLAKAEKAVADYMAQGPEIGIPQYYLHPAALKWMKELIVTGKAKNRQDAYERMKEDLKSINSSVEVEQEEFDVIMAIKPMFLIHNYQ